MLRGPGVGVGVGVLRGSIAALRRGRASWVRVADTRLEPIREVTVKASASANTNRRFLILRFLITFINTSVLTE